METKKTYKAPLIDLIKLDNEISLALESTPPAGPEEVSVFNQNQEYFDSTAFKA